MRRVWIAIALCGTASLGATSDVRAARPLRLRPAVVAAGALITNPTVDDVAYESEPGALVVRSASGMSAVRSVPATCAPTAIGGGVVGLSCEPTSPGTPPEFMTVRIADGATSPLPVAIPAGATPTLAAIGARWARFTVTSAPAQNGALSVSTELLDRRSGRSIDLSHDPFGARRRIDLDAVHGARRLCAPLRRTRRGPGPLYADTYDDLDAVGSFALGVVNGRRTLRRCGHRAAVATYRGLGQTTLGDAVIARVSKGRVTVRSLVTGRAASAELPRRSEPAFPAFSLSRSRLWVAHDAVGGVTRYDAARLR